MPAPATDILNERARAPKEMPPDDVRGYDVRTGKLLWTFHVVPRKGEFGNETWLNDSWTYSGNSGTWSLISADEDLGYVYLPFEEATGDYYGGTRPGNNLFAESIMCLDAKTGKRVWHFQTLHHGIWDYDLPAAPVLADITVNGRRIKAVAQVSKQAYVYVLDRVTGVSRCGRSKSGPCRRATCPANGIHRRSRFRPSRRRSISKASPTRI